MFPHAERQTMMLPCQADNFNAIWSIVNDGATAYKGIIPDDRWHEPYMTREELRRELESGVEFWGFEEEGELIGVMGIQGVLDVTLIRHAYVKGANQQRGVGGMLLKHLLQQAKTPVLIGTWSAAVWAIRFYQQHGFRQVSWEQKEHLLRAYWSIPERQIETSVVLADQKWYALQVAAR